MLCQTGLAVVVGTTQGRHRITEGILADGTEHIIIRGRHI